MDLLDLGGTNPWRTASSRIVFDNGRLRLREDAVIQPDGQPGSYAYLEVLTPVVAVVPVDADQHVYLVRQWRYPWRRNSWEIPAGGGEGLETPFEAAQRELAEEVGVAATDWEPLGHGYSSATIDSNWSLFLARGLTHINTHTRDGSEHDLVAQRIPLAMAVEAAMDGRIAHGLSVVGLLRAARRLGI